MNMSVVVFFFFKQKTAYEMRISDWSSDVCSSDLAIAKLHVGGLAVPVQGEVTAIVLDQHDQAIAVHPANVDDAALRHRLDRRAFASSDPVAVPAQPATGLGLAVLREQRAAHWPWQLALQRGERLVAGRDVRSEERRVGKGCGCPGRTRGWP